MARFDWDGFCGDYLPGLLTSLGETALAPAVSEDIRMRASSFAASGRKARDVLRAPFIEEVSTYEPAGAPISLLAAVNVVVRCSRLEEAHAAGGVGASGIKAITSTAAGPLSAWLNEHYNPAAGDGPAGSFEGLDARYPRAWAALEALAQVPDGGRSSFRVPRGPEPELPQGDEIIELSPDDKNKVVLSGTEPRFDQTMMGMLDALEPGMVLVFSSLSRLSRNLDKMLRTMEIVLSRGAALLTTNHLLRPGEVFTRRNRLVQPDSHDPLSGIRDVSGLSGVHRKSAESVLEQLPG